MNANENLINKFYTAFKNKDWAMMQTCYADDATFTDAVFNNLNALEVRKMWEMLVKNGKDMELIFKDVWADDDKGGAYWEATYTFSRTGNTVVNKINASFTFKDGKITSHRDAFDFYSWAKQAFGITGLLMGWTPYFKRKIRKVAADNLAKFMATH
ncbi:nuclear transport factor 2 family protein [Pedobacter sp. PWIIR3]